jgi:hypothetical protein
MSAPAADVVAALLALRRSRLRDAAAMRAVARTTDADEAEAEAQALEAWVTVRLGLIPAAELEAKRQARDRLVHAAADIDTPEIRGHRAWLAGYRTGRRLVSAADTDS